METKNYKTGDFMDREKVEMDVLSWNGNWRNTTLFREIKRGIPGVASGCGMGDPHTSLLGLYSCTQRTHMGRSTVSTL